MHITNSKQGMGTLMARIGESASLSIEDTLILEKPESFCFAKS